jgi:leader peptidase (prepilin peptidase)/N-methyltransferase
MIPTLLQFADAFPTLFGIFVFAMGASIGSFLNVVILRLPLGLSIVKPGSHCSCGRPIAWYDNIPIVSWFLLRGRARCCGSRFSFRYPIVEALTAGLFLACWRLLPPGPAVCGWVFMSGLVAATFIDADHLVIPDAFSLGLGVAGVLLAFAAPDLHGQHSGFFALDSLRSGCAALIGLLVGSGLVFWIAMLAGAVLRKEAMGIGDVKFVGAIGAFCGWHGAVFSIFGGAAVGTLGLALVLAWRKLAGICASPESAEAQPAPILGAHLPFGPMLAVAGALYFLLLHRWVDPWFAQSVALFYPGFPRLA